MRKLLSRWRSSEEDDYWYYNMAPSMMGAIMDLYSEQEPKRGFFRRRQSATPESKPTFGFGRVLDEPEE